MTSATINLQQQSIGHTIEDSSLVRASIQSAEVTTCDGSGSNVLASSASSHNLPVSEIVFDISYLGKEFGIDIPLFMSKNAVLTVAHFSFTDPLLSSNSVMRQLLNDLKRELHCLKQNHGPIALHIRQMDTAHHSNSSLLASYGRFEIQNESLTIMISLLRSFSPPTEAKLMTS